MEPPPATAPLAVRMRPRTLDEVVGQAHLLRPGRAAAAARRGRRGRVGAALRAARHREDHDRAAAGRGRRAALRRALGALLGGEGAAAGDRRRPAPARSAQPPDRAVHRRGAPLLQDPAGRAARRGGGPRSCCWSPRPPRTRPSRWCRRCCRARWCCGWSRSPRTTCAPCCAGPSPTSAGSPGRSPWRPTPRTRSSAWPRATPGARSPRWRPPPTASRAPAATTIDLPAVERAVTEASVRYDRQGDQHYDVISAFIKSIRGSDPDAALHYLARMLVAGEDPRFIARRLMVHASEDVGLADPTALQAATAAAQVVQLVGLPECRIALAQATLHLATAPKSNAVVTAIDAAMSDVRGGAVGAVPAAPARRPLRGRAEAGQRGRLPLPARRPGRRGGAAVPARRAGRPRLLHADPARGRARAGRPPGTPAPGHPRSALTSTANCMAR